MAINTKDIPTGGGTGITKTLQPENKLIKINSIFLAPVPWGENEYNLMLNCESPDMGEDFEGFYIDKDNPDLGRHAGQVGRVRASQYTFKDQDLNGVAIKRDLEIVKFLKHLFEALGKLDWFEAIDGQFETIEELVNYINQEKPFEGIFLNACLAGKQYTNNAGYTNHDLYFPKFSKLGVPFENSSVDSTVSRVYKFNKEEHIYIPKQKDAENFEPEAQDSEFEL